jgi:cytochrome c biogenesis protein CcdA
MPAEIERTSPRPAHRVLLLLASIASLLVAPARAAPQGLDNHAQATLFVRADGDDVKAAVKITLDAGYHIGHGPTEKDLGGPGAIGQITTITLIGDGFEWSTPRFPEPERENQEFGATKTWLNVHYGAPVIWLRGHKTNATADVSKLQAKLVGLTCNASGCVPYGETVDSAGAGSDKLFEKFPADLVVAAAGGAGGTVANGDGTDAAGEATAASNDPAAGDAAASTTAPPAGGGPDPATSVAPSSSPRPPTPESVGLWAFLATAVGWGLFSLLMPCTYPMIPITISYFTKQASARHSSLLPLSLCYGAGIVLIYVLIGVVVGPPIVKFASHWITNLIIGGFFVLFALSLFGAILLQPPQFMMSWAGRATKKGGYGGVFLLGALLVVTSFTCTAPFVGSLLAAGGSSGSLGRVSLGMAVFGLTMAIPFVFLALVPGKVKQLPKSGEWMHTLKVTLGFVELAAALKFFSNVDLVLQWHVLSRELFLLLWAATFGLAALYLFGVIRLRDDREPVQIDPSVPVDLWQGVGSGRFLTGVVFFLFAIYNLHGALGGEMDWVMKAMAPPYSTRVASLGGSAPRADAPVIVVDDFEEACRRAASEGKLVFANFTGFT